MFQRLLNYQPIVLAFLLSFSLILIGCQEQSPAVQPSEGAKQQLNNDRLESEGGNADSKATVARKEGKDKADNEVKENNENSSDLAVHYIDVGQGDATLFKGPNFTILIDAGRHDSRDVVPYLRKQGVSDIDLMILTHPHADHIGQADIVMQELVVKEVWMSGDEHTTRTFERVLDAALQSNVEYHEPRAGESFTFGSALVEVVSPLHLTGNLNEGSVSVRITYGDIKFLFTGDAEQQAEADMIDGGHDLQADIFQLGHHGSSTSNTKDFLNKVQPKMAIYSAAEDNSYGHPHDEILTRINSMGIDLYGTDVHGTIIVITDGKQYTVATSKSGIVAATSTNTKPKEVTEPKEAVVETDNDCININTASKANLEKIIHLSTARIAELIQFRPFSSVDELTQISGISTARLADIYEQGFTCVEG